MAIRRSEIASDDHRVLKFRPRTLAHTPVPPAASGRPELVRQPPEDLSRFERRPGEQDDYRHRMLANIAAVLFTVALTAIGIWLATSMAELRKTQDCVLIGRRDCAPMPPPHP